MAGVVSDRVDVTIGWRETAALLLWSFAPRAATHDTPERRILMAALESYSPCPCGSGQKYKWCCQKAEPFAERSQRLAETGQADAALAVLDEGLAKNPGIAWLAMRKAVLLAREEKLGEAGDQLRALLRAQPGHVGAHNFFIRILLESEDAQASTAQLQEALARVGPENRPALALTAQIMGTILGELGHVPAALAHLRLAMLLAVNGDDGQIAQTLLAIESNVRISPWLRNPYPFAEAPADLPPEDAEMFSRALEWANQGLWSTAAAAFEVLSGHDILEADCNLGLCLLWLADEPAAAAAFRRYIPSLGDSVEAVDLEALCQITVPPTGEDLVGHVQLTWSVRDRESLLRALRNDPAVHDDGQGPSDPEDPESPVVDAFSLLDRPKPAAAASGLELRDLPRIEARVTVSENVATLDLFDDGRLERVSSRFTEIARTAIPPAHPRTKVLKPISRNSLRMQPALYLPENLSGEEAMRFAKAESARMIREVWPDLRLAIAGGKTPRQAAKDPRFQVPLRAAFRQFAVRQSALQSGSELESIRNEIGIALEPAINPATIDIDRLHISRISLVPVRELDDTRLVSLFMHAHRYMDLLSIEATAKEIVERPQILDSGKLDRVAPYADLANIAISSDRKEDAFEWLERGRRSDRHPPNAVRWDLLEVRLRARADRPEEWVPQLAIVLERYAQDRAASSQIMSTLIDMGLVQVAPNPDDPDQMLVDTRRLQAVLAKYGPKITTAAGRLGVSATQNKIWTPGDTGSGSGGIWTPGSAEPAPPAGDKPKLILPGR